MGIYTAPNKPPRLMDQVRNEIRRRNYSRNTEKTYVYWVKQYIYFHQKQHERTGGHSWSKEKRSLC